MDKILLGIFLVLGHFIQAEALANCTSEPSTEKIYCSYQRTTKCKFTEEITYPGSISEIQEIVNRAIRTNKTVKAIGSSHSTTDIICTEGIPMDMVKINHISIDKEAMTATVGGGTKMELVYDTLNKNGLTLKIVPTFSGISAAGAIGTGAHGSSLTFDSSISSFVVKVKIVDGLGAIHEIDDEEELRAFRVHLGMLGIIYEVSFKLVPAYKMKIKNTRHNDSILFDGTALKMAREAEFCQMWWFPSLKSVVVAQGNSINYTDIREDYTTFISRLRQSTKFMAKKLFEVFQQTRNDRGFQTFELFTAASYYTNVLGKEPFYTNDGQNFVNPAVGHNYKLMSNNCNEKVKYPNDLQCVWADPEAISFDDSSITVDAANATEVFVTIRDIINEIRTYFPAQGLLLRFTKPTDAYLAKNQFNENIHVEWISFRRDNPKRDAKLGVGAYQAINQALAFKFNGKHHWGKNMAIWHTHSRISKTFDHLDKFWDIMKKYDPNRVFMNKFGQRLIGDPSAPPRRDGEPCALNGFCICEDDSDCAVYQTCSGITSVQTDPPIRVCLDTKRDVPDEDFLPYSPGDYEEFISRYYRKYVEENTTTTTTASTTSTTAQTTSTTRRPRTARTSTSRPTTTSRSTRAPRSSLLPILF